MTKIRPSRLLNIP